MTDVRLLFIIYCLLFIYFGKGAVSFLLSDRQQVRFQQIMQQLKSAEKYSNLSPQDMQLLATRILLGEQQKQVKYARFLPL